MKTIQQLRKFWRIAGMHRISGQAWAMIIATFILVIAIEWRAARTNHYIYGPAIDARRAPPAPRVGGFTITSPCNDATITIP